MNQLQQCAIKNATNKFSVIIGGPGVGKTLTISEIVKTWGEAAATIYLLGPTGKSVQVLQKLINDDNIKCYTIDYLLTLPAPPPTLLRTNIIIDEASMMTRFHFYKIIKYFKNKIDKLVLVGDIDQLPPVTSNKHELTLFESIVREENIIKTKLIESYRFTNNSLLKRVIETRVYEHDDYDDSYVQFKVPQEKKIDEYVQYYVKQTTNTSIAQFICFDNDKRKHYNKLIDVALAANKEKPIICTKNHYVDHQLKIANGEHGVLINNSVPYFKNIRYLLTNPEYELAYVITIHKAQGDSYPDVCVIITSPLTRELLYTVVSRASKKCIIIRCCDLLKKPVREEEEEKQSLFI
jgi:ATP-dependent exoDNAse (exonuclease V) alpha subunit